MADVNNVLPTHTPNEGRTIWNANDAALNEAALAAQAAIDEHATGVNTDHDDRYYPRADVDFNIGVVQAAIDALNDTAVKLTGAQEVGGEKTLTTSPKISTGAVTAEMILQSIYGGVSGQCKIGSWSYNNYHGLVLLINTGTVENPDWKQVMFASSADQIARFISDVYAAGKKLATEQYVQSLVKSGRYVMETSMKYTIAGAGAVNFLDNGNGVKRFKVPESCRLVKVAIGYWDAAHNRGADLTYDADHFFNVATDTQRLIRPELVIALGESLDDVTLKLYAENVPVGAQTVTEIFSQALPSMYETATEFYLTLVFAI